MPITTLTGGYGLFQAANSTAVVTGASLGQRGVVSGMLSLSRNLGLITGGSAMGAVFAMSVGATDILSAGPQVIAGGMRSTFGVAAAILLVALAVSLHRFTSSWNAKATLAQ